MRFHFKKIFGCMAVLSVWLMTCGFMGADMKASAGIATLMEHATGASFQEIKILDEWEHKVMAKVDDYVTVRAEANQDSAAVGRLYKGGCADIIGGEGEWTQIRSGNVEGWVNDAYLSFGKEAYERAYEDGIVVATVTGESVRIRQEDTTDSKILDLAARGDKFEVVEEYDQWIRILYNDTEEGFITTEFVEVDLELGTAVTMDEVEAKEKAEKAEKLKAELNKQLAAVEASGNDVLLLAALIQVEAGGQPYEGQVGVGAVVMNRVKSSGYPNSIRDVIYAPGQFPPANSARFASILANGAKASCMKAAQEAINGVTTVGSFTHFKNARLSVSGNSVVIGNHVFY